jgi:XapX domain-containing protein
VTVGRRTRAAAFARLAAVSFTAGLVMGGVYWSLDVTAPAPPLLSLTGLLGIGVGERAATALRARLRRQAPWQARPGCRDAPEQPIRVRGK